jgi:hypothetical protein
MNPLRFFFGVAAVSFTCAISARAETLYFRPQQDNLWER